MVSKTKYFIILLILTVFLVTHLTAQDDFEKWKQQQDEEFRAYKDANDKAFMQFLEDNWENFATFLGEERDVAPKPVDMPISEQEELEEADSSSVETLELPPLIIEEEEIVVNNNIETFQPEKGVSHEVDFWGLNLQVTEPKGFYLDLKYPVKSKSVADFWYKISNSEYESLLEQMLQYRENMNLNDWGYCLLLHKTGNILGKNNKDLTRLFIWFMLTKSGFEIKLGYNKSNIYLLIPSLQTIYGQSYVKIGDKKFYIINFEKKEKLKLGIYTYKGSYPDVDDVIDLDIKKSPGIKNQLVEKDLNFIYAGKKYAITITLDQNTASFFKDYPQTNMQVYFAAPLSSEAERSLLSQLRPIIKGKSEGVAVNMLLRFVQKAFPYKTDQNQFGHEKVFFQDEFLYYPFSDCEDRSIMFAYLVKKLVGLDVIGLDYPGHIATAVKFNSRIKGDTIVYRGERYLICDPTYINANIGKGMPNFRKKAPKVINI
jgi:hypothetical protein